MHGTAAQRVSRAIAVTLALGLVGSALGQWGQPAFGGNVFGQDYLRRDVPVVTEELQLDESQQAIFEVLFTDYERAFQQTREAFRSRQIELIPELAPDVQQREREIRDRLVHIDEQRRQLGRLLPDRSEREKADRALRRTRDQLRDEQRRITDRRRRHERADGVYEGMVRIQTEWLLVKQQLREQLISDLLSILTDRQIELWPALDRLFRREKTMQDGQFAGEGVNLFHLVRDQQLAGAEMQLIEPILEEYAIVLDQALQQRNAYLQATGPELIHAYQNRDFRNGVTIVDRQAQLRATVRDINESYAQMIIGALQEPQRDRLLGAYRAVAHGRIFQATRAQRALAAAGELPDLAPETLEAVAQLEASYLEALALVNERLVATTLRQEPENVRRVARWAVARMQGERIERPADPIREAFGDREELDEHYLALLQALLSEEHFESLPGVRRPRGRGGRGGR